MAKQKLIIDTDGGSDDAMAIAMALRDSSHEVIMITTVAGNVPAHQAAINVLSTIERAGSYEPPVYEGCQAPIMCKVVYCEDAHGADGMGNIGVHPTRLEIGAGHGVLKMIEALDQAEEHSIDIVTLGPLTNIALAMRLAPDTMRKVRRIVSMGSAGLGGGNISPVAEFNIWQDAEAAKIVCDFGIPLMLVGWDACLGDAILTEQDLVRLSESGPLGKFVVDINHILCELNVRRFGYPCLDMADPSAMAAALYPECIESCDMYYCQVDVSSGISHGSVLVDRHKACKKDPNVSVCSKLKGDLFKEYIFKTLGA